MTMPGAAELCEREWMPDTAPWLHLVLVHGVGEHCGRYESIGQQFAEAGIAVLAYDQRGHGASSGRRGDVERWTDLTGDAGRMVDEMRARADGGPVALIAHSLGGLVALDSVLSGVAAPDLLVLSSPGIGDGLPAWQHAVAPMIAKVRPTLVLGNGWAPDALSRDPAVGEAVAADPLSLDGVTVRLGAFGFAAQDRVNATIEELTIPTFVTQGGEDTLVPPEATEALGQVPGVARKLYPTLRHETLFEPEGPEVADDIITWLREAAAELEPYPASEAAIQVSTRSR